METIYVGLDVSRAVFRFIVHTHEGMNLAIRPDNQGSAGIEVLATKEFAPVGGDRGLQFACKIDSIKNRLGQDRSECCPPFLALQERNGRRK